MGNEALRNASKNKEKQKGLWTALRRKLNQAAKNAENSTETYTELAREYQKLKRLGMDVLCQECGHGFTSTSQPGVTMDVAFKTEVLQFAELNSKLETDANTKHIQVALALCAKKMV